MISDQIKDYWENGYIRHSLNFPTVKLEQTEGYRIATANKNIPNIVTQISTLLSQADINIINVINKSREEITYTMMDVNAKINEILLRLLYTGFPSAIK
ncbi:hypothetical protein [Coxiella-like endosymbiont]|uniref:hypothetical protein n=1 Tax=Coxiella-like endosymbiont TaxID=1592897 RepID=UPI00272B9A2B|nr:hypothetical protein [Coxiella-like endosymbiont]